MLSLSLFNSLSFAYIPFVKIGEIKNSKQSCFSDFECNCSLYNNQNDNNGHNDQNDNIGHNDQNDHSDYLTPPLSVLTRCCWVAFTTTASDDE